MINVTCLHLRFNHRRREGRELMPPARGGCDCFRKNIFKCGCFLLRAALKYAHINISIMESICWMMRVLRFFCVTWKLAACFLAALWILNCPVLCFLFEEILMRAGLNRASVQSLTLQLVDATDHLSGALHENLSCDSHAPDWGSNRRQRHVQSSDVRSLRPTRSVTFVCFTVFVLF